MKVWMQSPTLVQDEFRKFAVYGEPVGSCLLVNEIEDGAVLTLSSRNKEAQVELHAEALMRLTQNLAGLFGHAVVHPTEWRDKLVEIVSAVCEKNGSRCLDDDADRNVVVFELVNALASAAMPRPA